MKKTTVLRLAATIAIVLAALAMLCGCNTSKEPKVTEYSPHIRIAELSYDDADDSVTAYALLMDSEEEAVEGVTLKMLYAVSDLNSFYKRETITIYADQAAIFSAVDAALTQDERMHDGKTYNRLKVVLRYDTIRRSMSSDAEVVKSGNTYMHLFELDGEEGETVYTIAFKSADTGVWYSVAAAGAVLVLVIVLTIIFAVRKKHAKQ